jgi:hypothetical protein
LPADTIVFLSTLAAEGQGEEHTLTTTWGILLILESEMACGIMLQSCIDSITFADELMKAKGKRGSTSLWMLDTLIASKQTLLKNLATVLF